MPTLATLLTPLVLAGLTWADCSAVDPSTTGAPPSATGELDRNAGYEFFRTGQYQQALACYNEALKAAEADPSSDTRAIASELSDLAIFLKRWAGMTPPSNTINGNWICCNPW